MRDKITKVNRTLFELEIGILIFGAVCQLFAVFLKDKAGYSIGLWLGILIAMASAVHMWWSLDRALDLGEGQAVKTMGFHNVLRYLFIVALFALICVSGIGNPLSAFLGIMGLKASAYMHFITRKISIKIYGEEILPPLVEEPAGGQEK
ncbi:MAG: ATP synthase subunit I [Clostridium sp.]|nr:ATP synthase subunit I [Clostridium sp.]